MQATILLTIPIGANLGWRLAAERRMGGVLWASEQGGGVVSMGVLGLRGVVRFMIFFYF